MLTNFEKIFLRNYVDFAIFKNWKKIIENQWLTFC